MQKYTLLVICLIAINFIQAQCTQSGSNFGNNTVVNYDVSGDIDVVLNANNTISVNLGNNFSTAPGPDVRIFLVDRGTLTDNQLKVPQNFLASPRFEVGLLSNFNGTSSHTVAIPNNVSIADYQTIFFYCLQFNQFWDFGSYTPIHSGNCTLSNDSIEAQTFSLFPNPAVDHISIKSNSSSLVTEVSIYNSLGKRVQNTLLEIESLIDISDLKDGMYFVRITDANNFTSTKKLLKKSQ